MKTSASRVTVRRVGRDDFLTRYRVWCPECGVLRSATGWRFAVYVADRHARTEH